MNPRDKLKPTKNSKIAPSLSIYFKNLNPTSAPMHFTSATCRTFFNTERLHQNNAAHRFLLLEIDQSQPKNYFEIAERI
jgi:hypothetical protein